MSKRYVERKWILAGSTLIGLYCGMRNVAKKKIEMENLDDDNPYINNIEGNELRIQTIYERKIKPAIDHMLSFGGLIVLAPVYGLISLAVYLDDPGPIFFKQKRVGKNGKFFLIHKFRTMKMNTPHDIPTHQLTNPEQYITRVGGILRKTSLDEIPQIWDIFRGKMSIIGPRPALWNQEDLVSCREQYNVNSVTPGLSGLAQIKGRDELIISDKAAIDGEYVSILRKGGIAAFTQDLKCFAWTVNSVLHHDGVVEGGTGSFINQPDGFENNIFRERDIPVTDEEIEEYGFKKKFNIDKTIKKRVLVTGAGSYIGEAFCAYAKQYYPNLIIKTIDVKNTSWCKENFSSFDTIFHVAGLAHVDIGKVNDEEKKRYYSVNTDLAIEIAKKAKDEGVKQFVFMSSMIIYGKSAPYGIAKVIDEKTIPAPENFYGDSKWQGDKGVRKLGNETFHVAVLRPPMIYGKGSKGNYSMLSKIAKRLPVFPSIKNQRSMLYIGNLCEFVAQLICSGESGIYFPQNEEYSSTVSLVKLIRKTVGKQTKTVDLLNLAVKLAFNIPGKLSGLVNKAFGNIVYHQRLSRYLGLDYQIIDLATSINLTESTDKISYKDYGVKSKNIKNYEGIEGLVSIIMPAYNCEKFIKAAIESVKSQTYNNWELLIVDDCSTDSTAAIIQKYTNEDERILCLMNKVNSGAAASRNKAIEAAKGQYLAFLDSDDVWKEQKLEKQLCFMKENDYSFTCTSYNKIDNYGQCLNRVVKAFTIDYEGLLRRCPGNSTVIYDANRLGKYTIPLIKKRNDYVMWLMVIKKAGMLYGLNQVLSSHRIVPNSISSSKTSLVKYHWIVYKDIEKMGVLKSIYLIAFWIVKVAFKIQ